MSFPSGAQTTVLTISSGLADGSPGGEVITLTPTPEQLVSTALGDIREGDPITIKRDKTTGTASVRLLNTDAATYVPSGWTYKVERGDHPAYYIELPVDLGPAVELADLTPTAESPGEFDVVVPVSSLGTAATKNVGTTAGTVAAGNDSRFGTIDGVITIGGTPAAGKVPQLTSPTTGAWTTPAGGGGGGVVPIPCISQIDAGIVVLTDNGSWLPVIGSTGVHVRRVVPNVRAGDIMQFTASFLGIGTVYFLDGRVLKGDGSPSRYLSSADDDGLGLPASEGYAPWYTQLSFKGVSGFRTFIAQEDEIAVDGTWTIEMVYMGTAITDTSNHLYWGGGYRGAWDVWHWPVGA